MPTHRSHHWVPANLRIEVGVQIDESGRHNMAFCIDFFGRLAAYLADVRYGIATYSDIADIGCGAAAVDNSAAANN